MKKNIKVWFWVKILVPILLVLIGLLFFFLVVINLLAGGSSDDSQVCYPSNNDTSAGAGIGGDWKDINPKSTKRCKQQLINLKMSYI